jgi:hypothetical protein
MDNEKMLILKMLESGKITSEEAARLLQSAGDTPTVRQAPSSVPPIPKPSASSSYDKSRSNNGHAPHDSGRGIEEMATEIGKKAAAFAREMEPKLQKAAEVMASTIATGADKLSRSLSESTVHTSGQASSAPKPKTKPAPRVVPGAQVEKNIEMSVSSGYNELDLSCVNGELHIRGYNGDKITATLSYKTKRAGAAIELMKLGGRYYLSYEPDDFQHVSIDAYVPERAFSVIKLDNINGAMDVSSLAANEISISNANGSIRMAQLAANVLKGESSNGKFTLSNLVADEADIENVNGSVEADGLDVARLSLTNFNGPLSLWVSDFVKHKQYDWSVETGNAKLNMNLPAAPDLGYMIKARAAMGEIRLGLTGLQYTINDPALAEARSAQYDAAAKQIRLNVETSNAPLIIN